MIEFLDMYEWLRLSQKLLLEHLADVFNFLFGSCGFRMRFFSIYKINSGGGANIRILFLLGEEVNVSL